MILDDSRIQHSLLLNLQTLQRRTEEQRKALQIDLNIALESKATIDAVAAENAALKQEIADLKKPKEPGLGGLAVGKV